MDIKAIQQYLIEHEIDAWLLADFHARNSIAVEMLKLDGIVTRRSFYLIPATGEPFGLVHAVEQTKFTDLPGRKVTYSGYQQLERELRSALEGRGKVAMEYSPKGRLPYIGLVDAGTAELVRGFGVEIISSADLVANFQARLSVEQIAMHRIAANNLIEIKSEAFAHIARSLQDGRSITENDVMQFILDRFEHFDMLTRHPPICAVDGNAGDPHYEPTTEKSTKIEKGQLILIDLWAKIKEPGAAYADITWMGYAGKKEDIPARYTELFAILVKARDAAVSYIHKNVETCPVHGCDVDDVCRAVIDKAGYGKQFVHRTGHSIATDEHGTGPNIDNLETEDRRKLQKGHLFSIEPGIYMSDCGFRTEINMLIGHNGGEVTTLPLQTEILPLF
jgi:Xaa-Pro aminopeptidase